MRFSKTRDSKNTVFSKTRDSQKNTRFSLYKKIGVRKFYRLQKCCVYMAKNVIVRHHLKRVQSGTVNI